jgi:hypothetical protein
MTIDVEQLGNEIVDTVSGIIERDVTLIRSFSRRQVDAIAQQAAFVADGIKGGQITPNTQEFFLEELEHMAESFAKTLVRLATVTFEKIWNAVVGTVWKAIESAVGFALPLPLLG